MRGPRLGDASSWVVAALALVAVLPLWTGEFPPLTDLPQHAAQVSILRHWNDPACGYPALYEIHWLTPNTLAYALAWALSFLVDIPTALRLLLSLAVVALALVTARTVRGLGGDPWWALLVLPLAYGFPMSFGFLGFVVAAPLVVALLAPGLRYAREPTLARGLGLGLACAALFAAHLFALGFALVVLAGLVVAAAPGVRAWPRRLAPLALALPLPLAWWWTVSSGPAPPTGRTLYLGGIGRLWELPSLLTGIPGRGAATLALAVLLVSLAATRPRLSRDRARWLPLAGALALALLAPNSFRSASYVAPRFAYLVLPTLLLALDAGAGTGARRARRSQLVVATLLLLAAVELRYLAIAREGAGLSATLAAAPDRARLLYLAYDRASRWSADTPFIHWGMLYAVGRCGVAESSFARGALQPVRYRPGVVTPLPPLIEYAPYRFRWEEHGGAGYDLFLVRSAGEPDLSRIAGSAARLAPLAHEGFWWLYENPHRGEVDGSDPAATGSPPGRGPAPAVPSPGAG